MIFPFLITSEKANNPIPIASNNKYKIILESIFSFGD